MCSSRTAACIKLGGGCQKPWCQVKFPTGGGDRVGWVDSKHLAPAERALRPLGRGLAEAIAAERAADRSRRAFSVRSWYGP